MNLQGRSLETGLHGVDVALLQSELRQLGYAITDDEAIQSSFGEGTRQAVLDFQKAHGLEASGIVDSVTAKKINAKVDALQPKPQPFVVRGQVHYIGTRPAEGVVQALDQDLGEGQPLGETVIEPDGHYGIPYSVDSLVAKGKQRADLVVRVLGPDRKPLVTSPTVYQAKPIETVDLTVESKEDGQPTARVVRGQVRATDGNPIAGLTVRAFDRNQGSDRLLREGVTDDTGRYTISYSVEDKAQQIALVVRVFDQKDALVAESELIQDPLPEATVDLYLKAQPIPAPRAPGQERVVAGQVRHESGRVLSGARLRAFHIDERGALRLGEDTTDSEGRYTIPYSAPPGVEAVQLRVVVSDTREQQLRESDLLPNAGVLEIVNLIVPNVATTTFSVDGTVVSPTSAAVGGLRVEVVSKRIGGDELLATTETDARGSYRTAFQFVDSRSACPSLPDLQARVYSGKTFLAASKVRYNASSRETLNVHLDDKVSAGLLSEHETLVHTLACQVDGNLSDLQETQERQDIMYLANKTGWDARAVAMAALAEQFSARTKNANGGPALEPALFYALFRAGLPANEAALYQTDAKTVQVAWEQAAAKGVIPGKLRDVFPQAAEQFHTLAAQKAMDGPALVGLSALKEMVSVSLGDDEAQQRQFVDLYTRHRADMPAFWEAVRGAFGEAAEQRLRLDGQLAYLTLNNAPLVRKLHASVEENGLTEVLSLVHEGYYRTERWQQVIGDDKIPPEIPGKERDEKRRKYADVLAAQVRLSFPTAVVAQMVKSGETPVANGKAEKVHAFLFDHQGKFEIGQQPVAQYIARHQLEIEPDVTQEIMRIQRVYQITPSDAALNALLEKGVDSAYKVVNYEQEDFVQAFKDEVGGEVNARLIHAKAQEVYNTVLNLAVSYLTARTAPGIGVHSPAGIVDPDPAPRGPNPNTSDVIAYPTLESLLGEMDYCDCEHCRSILSPAAYLVDLLMFLDRKAEDWQAFLARWQREHGGARFPFINQDAHAAYERSWNEAHPGRPVPSQEMIPLEVLLERRPDLARLPLTCENTNTPLPYIDLVNETLEHYVASGLTLAGYTGHSTTGDATTEELRASPQFGDDKVSAAADKLLAGRPVREVDREPLLPPLPPLPFHRPLENLRRYFDKFGSPLPEVMEALRSNDNLERPDPANPSGTVEYGWRDILMEELRISRAEYALLTQRKLTAGNTDVLLTLKHLFGYLPSTSDADVLSELTNAKAFTRRVGISYEELIEILKTRFVNPHSTLIPKLERLGVPFATLKRLKDDPTFDAAFDAAIADDLDAAQYDRNIKAWVRNQANYDNIMSLITLTDPTGSSSGCSFDTLELRYANPDNNRNGLRAFEYIRLIRFIRLWKKLGWTVEQTDKAITALYPSDGIPEPADDAAKLTRLDEGFRVLLPRLGVITRVIRALSLSVKNDLLPLLACFAPLDTHGSNSLYRQMFLSPALLKQDGAFADDGYGQFLTDNTQKIKDHSEALRAAFRLTNEEFAAIAAWREGDASPPLVGTDTSLTVADISKVFRRGWLARKLKLSVQEFLLLARFTRVDPFALPDLPPPSESPEPPVLRFIEMVKHIRASSIEPAQVLYLIWNQDISGKSAPYEDEISNFARTLRSDLAAVESEFAVADDPEGQIARTRMALVYGNAATDLFFSLVENTLVTEVPYDRGEDRLVTSITYVHTAATLEQAILDAAPALIAYDHAQRRLSFTGTMTSATRTRLKAVGRSEFQDAVDELYAKNQIVMEANLEQPIAEVAPGRIAYDDFRKRLSYTGELSSDISAALARAAGVIREFPDAVNELYEENQRIVAPFFARYPELRPPYQTYKSSTDPIDKKRSDLLAALLRELKPRRKRQQALQTIGAVAKTPIELAGALLYNKIGEKHVLHAVEDNTRPAVDDLTGIEAAGLASAFYFRDTAAGAVDLRRVAESELSYAATGSSQLPAHPVPGSAISGIWSGYLEVPENGFYNFRIESDAGAPAPDPGKNVSLTLNGTAVALARNGNIWNNRSAIELRAGTLYAIYLQVDKVHGTLALRWQSSWESRGRGWEVIPARYLYSAMLTGHLRQVYTCFRKVTTLAAALKLTANEIARLASREGFHINGQSWLNTLPVSGAPDNATSSELLRVFIALLDFALLKAALSPSDERLLAVLQDPEAAVGSPVNLLFTLTRWEPASRQALLDRFRKTAADLSNIDTFRRVHEAYVWVKKLGVPASALLKATTNEPDATTVRDLQAALRARYDEDDWLEVLKPINDEMRGLRRDALVAYILHQLRVDPASKHIDTPDKLFEYFLMDVQMDPCMQTSRIRHALSSVQLFIDRCLMNLEPRVAPSALNAKHWEWMSRYRVWEANRKVFLYPENWLDAPRDDESPFCKEVLSELLASDITEDRAAATFLNYLNKLEGVAKLEPCGIYYAENEPSKAEDNVAHVVARTASAPRHYYYRSRASGSWTPWEPIGLGIEDNPVVPVVWNRRLFLFWLRTVLAPPQPATPQPGSDDTSVGGLARQSRDSSNTRVPVNAILCWSEYYNGKWQPAKTSDVDRPLRLRQTFDPPGGGAPFDRSALRLWTSESGGVLTVSINYQDVLSGVFALNNTHSQPQPAPRSDTIGLLNSYGSGRSLSTSEDILLTRYSDYSPIWSQLVEYQVLRSSMPDRTVEPHHALQSPWEAPFFYEDARHAFYVTTVARIPPVSAHDSFGKFWGTAITPKVSTLILRRSDDPRLWNEQNADIPLLGSGPIERSVPQGAQIERVLGMTGTILYDGREIGPEGSLQARP